MSANVYWCESDVSSIAYLQRSIEMRGCTITNYQFESDLLRSIEHIRSNPGPIVLGLTLNDLEPVSILPSTKIFREIRTSIGPVCPILVFTARLTLALEQELIEEYNLTKKNIFMKPLVSRRAEFVNRVVDISVQLQSSSWQHRDSEVY